MAKIILLYNVPIPTKQPLFSACIVPKIHRLFKAIQCLQLIIQIHFMWRLQFSLVWLKTYIERKNFLLVRFLTNKKPLKYSCSHVAKMANYLTLELDKKGNSNVSCIAGFRGNVKNLVGEACLKGKVVNFND